MVLIEDAYGLTTHLRDHRLRHDRRGTLLGIFVFERERAADAIDAGDQAGATAQGAVGRFGILDTVLLLFTITAMVLRLGA